MLVSRTEGKRLKCPTCNHLKPLWVKPDGTATYSFDMISITTILTALEGGWVGIEQSIINKSSLCVCAIHTLPDIDGLGQILTPGI